jgi:hypothetical protein
VLHIYQSISLAKYKCAEYITARFLTFQSAKFDKSMKIRKLKALVLLPVLNSCAQKGVRCSKNRMLKTGTPHQHDLPGRTVLSSSLL